MPTYEYQCLKCKKRFDHRQKMTDKPLKKCVRCRGKVERLISAGTGLIFKGSGFYATDYKNKPAGAGKTETKNETKPSAEKKASPEKKSPPEAKSSPETKKD